MPIEMSTEQRLLRRYLDRYRVISLRKKHLIRKLQDIKDDFNSSAFHAVAQGMGGGKANRTESDVPDYVMKVLEVEDKIQEQIEAAASALEQIEAIIDKLPTDSDERVILSAKYVSRMSELDICELIPCSRSTFYRVVDKAIEQLLDKQDVLRIVHQYAIDVTFGK